MKTKLFKVITLVLAMAMILSAVPVMAEEAASANIITFVDDFNAYTAENSAFGEANKVVGQSMKTPHKSELVAKNAEGEWRLSGEWNSYSNTNNGAWIKGSAWVDNNYLYVADRWNYGTTVNI